MPEYTTPLPNQASWLIWSREHWGWWKAGRCGYTQQVEYAGRYTYEEACAICYDANKYLGQDEQPEETMLHESLYRGGL